MQHGVLNLYGCNNNINKQAFPAPQCCPVWPGNTIPPLTQLLGTGVSPHFLVHCLPLDGLRVVWEGGVIWEWDSIPIQDRWDRCLNHGEWRSGWSQRCGRDQRSGGQGWWNVGKHSYLWM